MFDSHAVTIVPNDARELSERLFWWLQNEERQNFGDYLSKFLCDHLASGIRVRGDVYRLIGSVISDWMIHDDLSCLGKWDRGRIVFWGCGARDETPLTAESLERCFFCGVRGPLTRAVLNLPDSTPLGDPALLTPILYQPRQSTRTKGKAICVPHFHEKSSDAQILETTGADAVVRPSIAKSPEALTQILDDIGSAGFVLAGSLHAAIVACAYGAPFCYFDGGVVDLPFKWRDFSASVNIGTFFANNVAEGQAAYESLIRPRLRKPLLFPILAAAPFRVQSAQLLKAALHDAERLGGRDPIDVGAFSRFVELADRDIAAIAAESHRLTLAAAEKSLKEESLAHADTVRQLRDLTGKYDALSGALSEARARASAAQAVRGAATQAEDRAVRAVARAANADARAARADARALAIEQELQRVSSAYTSLEQSSESRFSAAQKEISYLKRIAEILKEIAEIGRQSAQAYSENTRRPLRTVRRIIALKAIKRGMKLGIVSKEGKLDNWFSRHTPDRCVNMINESLITRQRQPVLASGKASGWSSAQRMRGGGSWLGDRIGD